MGRAFVLFLMVGWVTGCGGEAQGSKPDGKGGSSAAGTGGNEGGAGAGSAPPPAQGAFWASVRAVSPVPAGKMCPAGATLTFDLPAVDLASMPSQTLDADTYVQRIVDGEDGAAVTCSVQGTSSFTLEGKLELGNKSLSISNGSLGADKKGTAQVTLRDNGAPGFAGALSSPSTNCAIDAAAAMGNNFQVKAGSLWGYFSCPSVEQAPSDYCQAEGYFVLENCDQ